MGLAIGTMISISGCELATSFDGYSAARDAQPSLDAGRDAGVSDAGRDSALDVGVVDAFVVDAFVVDTGPRADTGVDSCVVNVVTTCAHRCGSVVDSVCGVSVNCGDLCVLPETCGGGAGPTYCGCVADPMSATCSGRCGPVTNNCGTRVDCGNPCVAPQSCGGGGTVSVCGCTVVGDACAGTACGTAVNNCGGTEQCDSCSGSRRCDRRCDLCLSPTESCP